MGGRDEQRQEGTGDLKGLGTRELATELIIVKRLAWVWFNGVKLM